MTMPQQKPGKSRQDYGTPPELLEAVKKRLHIREFAIDLAASYENSVASQFYHEQDSALEEDNGWVFNGWCWLNPPYSNIAPWVEKAAKEAQHGTQIAVLIPASVGANWWRDWVEPYSYQSFLNGRLTFVGETTPYPKDCALLLYHPWQFTGHEIWNWRGYVA